MSIAQSTFDIPKNPAERRAWVCYQLRLRGNSLRRIAQQLDVSHQAVSNALMTPSSRIEVAIADALGTTPAKLFAERYDRDGQRLPNTRPDKNTTPSQPNNVQRERAA
ncbi:MAG TPA: helix-turn-helix domain-containing protein [Aliidongia sp.]|uniref:helix-turn-helix domain-containing protein n=1 Tax=Aliidongia sp. TaxID=1914230 RepID=UPI002DDCEEF8|nr:helix-turn-helix domain-containing protein [Aliidongia sp.]HEV2674244.1 helix-turn-helix domain-containing protein [Aliidongia sp.]